MRSIKVTLARTSDEGRFRIANLSYEGESGHPVETDVWNLVTQILRLMDRPVVEDEDKGFAYSFAFAFGE